MMARGFDRRERMAAQTRWDILVAARRLFAERGYAATSINDIAEQAGVAVQTIYSRLGSKAGIVLALRNFLEIQTELADTTVMLIAATTPREAVRAAVLATRGFPELCGDILRALNAAAGSDRDAAAAVAEELRRHRAGARGAIDRVVELGGLRDDLTPDPATALLSTATSPQAWVELVDAAGLSWDQAEDVITDAVARALLSRARHNPPSA